MDAFSEAIGIDFDGVLCAKAYPRIGKARWPLICELIRARRHGVLLCLWTCRTDALLIEAIEWAHGFGLTFDYIAAGWSMRAALRAVSRLARRVKKHGQVNTT